MPALQGNVGVLNMVPSGPQSVSMGQNGEVLTGGMNGFWTEQVARGNGYMWSTAIAGVALVAPLATTTASPTLANPSSSGKNIIIQKITYNRTAVGTPVEGGVVYCYHRALSFIGTAADLVSGTVVAGQNARLDLSATDGSGMQWVPTGQVFTGVPIFQSNAGISIPAGAITDIGLANTVFDPINGSIVVGPGSAFVICGNVSLSTTFAITIFGIVQPVLSYKAQ